MELKLHHIGHVVKNIQDRYNFYLKLGFQIDPEFTKPQPDMQQKVIVGVVIKGDIRVELLEPLDNTSPIYSFLQKGGGFHHLCYEVENLEEGIKYLKSFARQVTPITHSVWKGRKVVFFISKNNDIIELLEKTL